MWLSFPKWTTHTISAHFIVFRAILMYFNEFVALLFLYFKNFPCHRFVLLVFLGCIHSHTHIHSLLILISFIGFGYYMKEYKWQDYNVGFIIVGKCTSEKVLLPLALKWHSSVFLDIKCGFWMLFSFFTFFLVSLLAIIIMYYKFISVYISTISHFTLEQMRDKMLCIFNCKIVFKVNKNWNYELTKQQQQQ